LSASDNFRSSTLSDRAGIATAQRIDDVLALRDLVEELDAAELPRGFGRD
jgi:hypothetical protein